MNAHIHHAEAAADIAVAAPKNDAQANQVTLGVVILVVLMILGLLLTGRSAGG